MNRVKKEKLTEQLLEMFRLYDRPLKLNEISKKLNITADSKDYENLKQLLVSLAEDNIINKLSRRRYNLHDGEHTTTYKGRLEIRNERGIIEMKGEDFDQVIIKPRHLSTALEGDLVLFRLLATRPGKKPRGEVIEVIERNQPRFVGTIDYDGHFYFLIPDEEKFFIDFLIPNGMLKGAKEGDKVAAEFYYWDDQHKSPKAKVVEVLGRSGDPEAEFDSIVKEFDLMEDFPEEVIAETKKLKAPMGKVPAGRMDLREETIVTIDPPDARDFDDGLSLKILDNGNYYLGVHIADVSHYVTENSALDIEARSRSTSTYLVDRVVPMLPEKLSNDICSLRPDEDRNAFSVFMEFSNRGALKNYKITESVIRSKRRFSYDEVLEIINGESGEHEQLVKNLDKVARILRKKRFQKGGIDFETDELKFRLDEDKYPIEVYLKKPNFATQLVEECMLAANQTVAGHIKNLERKMKPRLRLPFLYRVHDEPDPGQLKEVLSFIATFGPRLNQKEANSKNLNDLLHMIRGSEEESVVNQVLIRAMAKAIYLHKNVGHYGLGFKEYTHFTSPIRRYPDLIIHRFLKEYAKGKVDKNRLEFLNQLAKEVGQTSSDMERRAMEAERASIKLASAMIADQKIGEEYNGTITGVTKFGLFVRVDKIYVEGLLHIRDLLDDYYIYDEKNFRLTGKRNKKVFRIGGRFRVKIINVNIEKRQIDFSFVGDVEE
ncbi:MAG: ribonuclease R [Candidatus Kapaibacterium sp.]